MPESYRYRPLSGPNRIRALELESGVRKSSALRGKLIEIDLSVEPQKRPSYEALSYVWGSIKGDRPIVCEGKEILVTQNCEAALRQLRYRHQKRLLWIDVICIDQSNTPERNHQVEMMRQTYRGATHVRIWLGSPSVDRSFLALRLSLKTSEAVFNILPRPWDTELHEFGADIILHLLILPYLVFLRPYKAHDAISRSPWFERIWTIQEVSFSRAATVHYGSIACEWDTFSNLLLGSDTSVFRVHDEDLRNLYSLRVSTRGIANDAKIGGWQGLEGRSYRDIREPHDIADSLYYTKATDPNDKIFGIYGILLLMDVNIAPPDYSKSVAEIYTETISAIFKTTLTFRFRHVFNPLENRHGLASWVPDWTASNRQNFGRSPRVDRLSASKDTAAFNIEQQQGTKLHVKGIIIDHVDGVGLAFPVAANTLSDAQVSAVLLSWREISKRVERSFIDLRPADREVESLNMLAHIMFRDALAIMITGKEMNVAALQEWLVHEKRTTEIPGLFPSRNGEDSKLSSYQFDSYVRPGWEGQKVFKTRSNQLAMAGSPTSVGDAVVLVAGSDVPLVVRPCGRDYMYIGPTYFPGAMLGEMWPDTVVRERFQLRDLTIV
ncbi:HET-domain-containing protein [Rhizodiscina lignyota]|uniref:HET-domain-containing protein n=1 Tax=Rhizodiscina lignyota TaxID=1504668 RepID=A0A9P4IPJ1_9PEZI|nr:HET-domain-containing protein [Rhizodiscina lignyota]